MHLIKARWLCYTDIQLTPRDDESMDRGNKLHLVDAITYITCSFNSVKLLWCFPVKMKTTIVDDRGDQDSDKSEYYFKVIKCKPKNGE